MRGILHSFVVNDSHKAVEASAENSQLACIGAILIAVDRNASDVFTINGWPVWKISNSYLRHVVTYALVVGYHTNSGIIIGSNLLVVPEIIGINLEELGLSGNDCDNIGAETGKAVYGHDFSWRHIDIEGRALDLCVSFTKVAK